MTATSKLTRAYWIDMLLSWADARLMPPQFAMCKRVLDELQAESDAARAIAEAQKANLDEMRTALGELLDGLDSNTDEIGGLSQAQWEVRISNARAALEGVEPEGEGQNAESTRQ